MNHTTTLGLAMLAMTSTVHANTADYIWPAYGSDQMYCDAGQFQVMSVDPQVAPCKSQPGTRSYAYKIVGICTVGSQSAKTTQTGKYVEKTGRFTETTSFEGFAAGPAYHDGTLVREGACDTKPWNIYGKCDLKTVSDSGPFLKLTPYALLPNTVQALVNVDPVNICNDTGVMIEVPAGNTFELALPTEGKRFFFTQGANPSSQTIPVQVAVPKTVEQDAKALPQLRWMFIFDVQPTPSSAWVTAVYNTEPMSYAQSKPANIRYQDLIDAYKAGGGKEDLAVAKKVNWRVKANFINNGNLGWTGDNTPPRNFSVETMTAAQSDQIVNSLSQGGGGPGRGVGTQQVESALKLQGLDYAPRPLNEGDVMKLTIGYGVEGAGTLKNGKISIKCQTLSKPGSCLINNQDYDTAAEKFVLQDAQGNSSVTLSGNAAQPGKYRVTASAATGTPQVLDIEVLPKVKESASQDGGDPGTQTRQAQPSMRAPGRPRTDVRPSPFNKDTGDPASPQVAPQAAPAQR